MRLQSRDGGLLTCVSVTIPSVPCTVVGLEAGQLFKGSLLANEMRSMQAVVREVGELPWSAAAASLMCRVPQAVYPRLKQRIERDAAISRDKEVPLCGRPRPLLLVLALMPAGPRLTTFTGAY